MDRIGWIGLGSIGHAMAANIDAAGGTYIVADPVNAASAPEHATVTTDNAEVAREAETVFLSLPDGKVSLDVCQQIIDEPRSIVKRVANTSTTGIAEAEAAAELLAKAGIGYVDCPVSGGLVGARAKTLAIIVSGAEADVQAMSPLLGMLGKVMVVGDRPGQAQALKLLNNFLAGTALVATSEAVAFGVACGLDMATIIEVVNAASGRNTATMIKFPKDIITGKFQGGFGTDLFAKDLQLYAESVKRIETPNVVGQAVTDMWVTMRRDMPGSDSTRIYPYIQKMRPEN
ncbi:NAD(P)-dependent oxidoreductase [Paralimibaculum aggregatum]|uniref:NAD(P)-dependent oxidoreductase n=1 Tax=Paralimibaculum aggregatum TaxID=3036245 RepID=A0ABQ6LSW7_9RHOB|nr:NAD(P)-dependent oxidoreductase [Limibaculum sp. NKW23]GMG85171.1 NAD(P)-dependent oxidoreductase [Limibaculum sp. NKW23]